MSYYEAVALSIITYKIKFLVANFTKQYEPQ